VHVIVHPEDHDVVGGQVIALLAIDLRYPELRLDIFRVFDDRFHALEKDGSSRGTPGHISWNVWLDGAWRQMAMILGHWQLRGYGPWAVEERESGRVIGRIGFFNPEGWPGFELGWVLGTAWHGRGYATEGAKAALRYAFEVMNREKIISLIQPANTASIRVAVRLGECLEGESEVFGKKVLIYGIHQEAWRSK